MFATESDPALMARVATVLAMAQPTRGQVQAAQMRLKELGRRAGTECGCSAGYWRHTDRGEDLCPLCTAHRRLRVEQQRRRWTRENSKRYSERRKLQIASREEHARAFREWRRDHPW